MIPDPPPDLEREAVRIADRLRVLGPRWAARSHAPDAVALEAVRTVLQELADLAADATGEPRRPVPALRLHGLADQVLVLSRDAGRAGQADAAFLALDALRRTL